MLAAITRLSATATATAPRRPSRRDRAGGRFRFRFRSFGSAIAVPQGFSRAHICPSELTSVALTQKPSLVRVFMKRVPSLNASTAQPLVV